MRLTGLPPVGPGRVAGLLVMFAVLAGAAPARALDPDKRLGDCPIELWRVRDGLPGGWVREILQTDDGYLWIGAFGGLVRYDGTRMVSIASKEGFRRVNDVNDLVLGAQGRLWIIPSYGGPVCLLGREVDNCLKEIAPLRPNTRLRFAARDGEATFLVGRQELYRHEAGNTTLLVRYADTPWNQISGIVRDGQGQLWLGTDVGLFSERQGRFLPAEGVAAAIGAPVQALGVTRKGALLVATEQKLFELSAGRLSAQGAAEGYPGGVASTLLEDRDGGLWIGTKSGLIRRTARGFERFGKADGLPDDEITALHEDREGSLWVGMRSGGLAQLTDRSLDTRQGPPELRGQFVLSLTQDPSGAFWFGTEHGLLRWKDGESRLYGVKDGLQSARVVSVRATPEGTVWVGTDLGLQRFADGKLGPPIAGPHPVLGLAMDQAGTLWVGSQGRAGRLRGNGPLEWIPTEAGTSWEAIRALEEDDQGTIWVAAIGGLARIENGRLVRANYDGGKLLPSARSVTRDDEGTLWMGTNGGLLRRKQGRFHLFAAAEGLMAENIYQVVADEVGFLWMGTSRGLFRISRAELEEVAAGRRAQVSPAWFDTSDERRDLTVANVRQPGVWRALDGRLWFAFDHGVVVVDPRRPHVNSRPPTILIEEALVDGRLALPGVPNQFPAGHGNLEFRFAALTLIEPRKAQLRYRLEGFDTRWIDAGGRREARYIRVPAGQYRFRVRGANADGVWNEAGASIELRIAPHFYRTSWFYGLCALGLLSLTWLLYRSRVDRLRRDYLAAFTERSRVARELHDTLLQSMSAVAMHLRGVRRKVEPMSTPAGRELETIENMVTLSLEETRRFVWNLREQPIGSGDLGRALGQLAERITAGRTPRAEVGVVGEVVPLPNNVQGDLFRIAQEALANAVKHAQASRIEVVLEYRPGGVRLRVSDDGQGFDPETAQGASAGHFGLVGMRERAARLGTFVLDTRPGHGTTVEVTVQSGQAKSGPHDPGGERQEIT